ALGLRSRKLPRPGLTVVLQNGARSDGSFVLVHLAALVASARNAPARESDQHEENTSKVTWISAREPAVHWRRVLRRRCPRGVGVVDIASDSNDLDAWDGFDGAEVITKVIESAVTTSDLIVVDDVTDLCCSNDGDDQTDAFVDVVAYWKSLAKAHECHLVLRLRVCDNVPREAQAALCTSLGDTCVIVSELQSGASSDIDGTIQVVRRCAGKQTVSSEVRFASREERASRM
ncbi:MAG: hypothetical protein MHM6MM_003049, partial [Cercozoa sp. M6MM]